MSVENSHDEGPGHAYVLPRAFSRNGTVSGSRKERLGCAFVELRERIKDDFLKVAKDWQVSAEELRRNYSYAYPAPAAGEPDPLCLENACEGLMLDLRCRIQTYAEQFWVPDNVLEAMLVDWLVSDRMGTERAPARFFIGETCGSSEAAPKDTEDPLSLT
jgi:hypothetical protein